MPNLGGDALTLNATALPSALADPWLPERVTATGAADLSAQLEWNGAPTGKFSLRQPSLVLAETPQEPIAAGAAAADAPPPLAAEIAAIEIAGTLDEERLDARLSATLPGAGGTLQGELAVTPPAADGPLVGTLTANLEDLAALDALVDGAEGLRGR